MDQLVREGECPQFPESPQPQVIYAERKREKQELTSIQILGIIFEITGVALALMGLIGEERILILDALPPVILGFPLLLTKKHPRLTLIWVLMALSFILFNPYTIKTAWWIPDGLIYLRRYLQSPKYPIYLFAGIAGIIRGLTLLPLLLFTGYTCGKTWAERWKRWKKGR